VNVTASRSQSKKKWGPLLVSSRVDLITQYEISQ
jgi:hypothetical protein